MYAFIKIVGGDRKPKPHEPKGSRLGLGVGQLPDATGLHLRGGHYTRCLQGTNVLHEEGMY